MRNSVFFGVATAALLLSGCVTSKEPKMAQYKCGSYTVDVNPSANSAVVHMKKATIELEKAKSATDAKYTPKAGKYKKTPAVTFVDKGKESTLFVGKSRVACKS